MCTAIKGICAAMRVCPLREIIIYIKISLCRSAAIKQICTAMFRSAAIREVCTTMLVCSLCEIIIYIKISLRRNETDLHCNEPQHHNYTGLRGNARLFFM